MEYVATFTIAVCSHLLMHFGSLYCKQYAPRSDCFFRGSLIRVHSVCFESKIILECMSIYAYNKTTFSVQNIMAGSWLLPKAETNHKGYLVGVRVNAFFLYLSSIAELFSLPLQAYVTNITQLCFVIAPLVLGLSSQNIVIVIQ